MTTEAFLTHIKNSAQALLERSPRQVLVLHHNDTDGLTSGAILLSAFERRGLPARSYSLEKPYPPVLQHILQDPTLTPDTLVIFADFGSGMLPTITELNTTQLPIFILDHHSIEPSTSPDLTLVNCRSFDICGSSECSAATICALFAQSLGPFNEDLLSLGLLGAYGDSQYNIDGSFEGLNASLFQQTLSAGSVSFDDTLRITVGNSYLASSLKQWLDHLGSIGYLSGGVDIALKGLRDGFDEAHIAAADKLTSSFSSAKDAFLQSLSLHTRKHIQSFITPSDFSEMGVKTVGLLCEALRDSSLISQEKYIVGFQEIPDRIPGLGTFSFDSYKISMRVPEKILKLIHEGKAPSLAEVLPAATRKVDGFVDACHPHAAATTIKKARYEEFLCCLEEEIESLV